MPGSPEEDDARRVLVRFVGALIAVVLAAALGLLVRRSTVGGVGDAAPVGAPGEVAAPPANPGDPAVIALPRTLGPLAGADVATYVASRHRALETADGEHAAVVSLVAYATEAEARSVLGPVSVRALMVAAPLGAPAVVRGPLAAWAGRERADVADQLRQFDQLLASPAAGDDQFVEQYRAEAARLTQRQHSIDPNGRVVFGAVVVGDAGHLRALAARPTVRLVDAAAGIALPPDAEIRGLRPEVTARAGDPATRPPA